MEQIKPAVRTAAPTTSAARIQPRLAGMRLYFALVVIGFVVAACVGAGLSWDGSYILFGALNRQEFFFPHDRVIHVFTQSLPLLLSQFTANTWLLGIVFGLGLAAVSFAGLAVSWLLVRNERPELFVWPVFATGFGLLPGQFAIITEAFLVLYLVWPLLLCVLLPFRRIHLLVVPVFAVLVVATHPTSVALLGMLAVASMALAVLQPERRRQAFAYTVFFLLITGLAVLRFELASTAYEQEQLTVTRLSDAYNAALTGTTLIGLAFGVLAAMLVFAGTWVRSDRVRLLLRGIELLCLCLAAVFFIIRSVQPQLWIGALDYRTLAIFVALPFFGAAFLEAYLLRKQPFQDMFTLVHRVRIAQVVGLIFCATMIAQSLTWNTLTQQLRTELARQPFACISKTSLPWAEKTAFNHWSLTSYAYLIQGRTPDQFVLGWDNCATAQLGASTPAVPWEAPYNEPGWFDLTRLGGLIAADRTSVEGCTNEFATGWYWAEQRGQSIWRWSEQEATLNVLAERAGTVTLRANALSPSPQPNTLSVLVNGTPVQQVALATDAAQGIAVDAIPLQAGPNVITLRSANPATATLEDGRLLAIGYENLTLAADQGQVCATRP